MKPANQFSNYGLYGALLTAWVAMLGSLYFSEVRHYVPCALCWYQRILMYPLALLLAVGLLRRDRYLPYLVLPFSIIGQGVSIYHYLLQKTYIFGTPTACSTGVPCTTAWINWLGFITIPFLAMIGFMLITIFCIISIYRGELAYEQAEPMPWLPVTIIVSMALFAYLILAQTGTAVSQTRSTLVIPTVAANLNAFTPVEPEPVDPALIAEGKQLFAQACAACHGPEGEGVANGGASLTDSELIMTHEDADVIEMIRTGRMPGDPENSSGSAMPPSGGRPDLTDEQLLSIIAYLRSSSSAP